MKICALCGLLVIASCVAFDGPNDAGPPQVTGSCDGVTSHTFTGLFAGPQTATDPVLPISEFLPLARPDCPVNIDVRLDAAETVRTTVDLKMELWCERLGTVDAEFPTPTFRFVQVAGDATLLHGFLSIASADPCSAHDATPFGWPFFPAKWHLIIERHDTPPSSQVFDLEGEFRYVPFGTWDDPA